MRYYGEEYKDFISKSIKDVHDSIKDPDYASNVRRVDVSSKNAGLKTQCVNAAGTASSHVDSIRGKLENLIDVLNTFYLNADATSDDVLKVAKEIRELLNETNAALVRMNGAVNGIGKYTGTKVTPKTLKSAGLNDTRCNELKASIWDKLFTIQSKNDKISYDAAVAFVDYINNLREKGLEIPKDLLKHIDTVFGVYIEKMKSLDPEKIPTVDMKRLEGIYSYYVSTRNVENSKDLEKPDIQNCVDVYEILDPKAKDQITDFFKEVSGESPTVDLNILRIKYALYTADEEYRNAMFYYMRYLTVEIHDDIDIDRYCLNKDGKNFLNLKSLRDEKNNNFSSFFHEFGHAIDDLSEPDEKNRTVYSSEQLRKNLVIDLRNHMRKTLILTLKINLPVKKREEVLNFFFSSENINVVDENGIPYPCPKNWDKAQVMAFYRLREYYGYKNYVYDKNTKTYVEEKIDGKSAHLGYSYGENPYKKPIKKIGNYIVDKVNKYKEQEREQEQQNGKKLHYGIRDDIIGGLTNNQIGGTVKGHPAPVFTDGNPVTNSTEVHNRLVSYNYWYSNNKRTNMFNTEYFAENWESGVLGYSTETATEVFGSARKEYEKIRDEIFEKTRPK